MTRARVRMVSRAGLCWMALGAGVTAAACAGSDDASTSTTSPESTSSMATSVVSTTSGVVASSTIAEAPGTVTVANPPSTSSARDVEFEVGANPCEGAALPAVAAFDPDTGGLVWSVCSTDRAHRSVVGVTDRVVYVNAIADEVSELVALDALDGRELWRRPVGEIAAAGGGWPKGSFAGSGVVVLVEGEPAAPLLVAVDAVTGAEVWRTSPQDLTVASTTPAVLVTPAGPPRALFPVAGTDEIVVVISTFGDLAGLDRRTGHQLWAKQPLGGGDESGDVAGLAPAAVLSDQVILPAGSVTVAIDATSGVELWRSQRLDDPWAADGHVVGSDPSPSLVAAVDAYSGATAWTAPGRESYGDRIAVGDGGTYVLDPGTGAGVFAYDLATGHVRWARPPQPYLGEPQEVLNDRVVLLWGDQLAAVSTRDGSVRWALRSPVGSDWMNTLGTNSTTIFVAINSVRFGD